MMMQMLRAGGLELMTDGLRGEDESNPEGYYELEKVKELDKGGDPSWLADARGRAVKIVAYLLRFLPDSYNYQVIFMHREMTEVLASQARMLTRRGKSVATDDNRMLDIFQQHVEQTRRLLASRSCFRALHVSYNEILADPKKEASRINAFLRDRVDAERMVEVVDPELYRNRGLKSV